MQLDICQCLMLWLGLSVSTQTVRISGGDATCGAAFRTATTSLTLASSPLHLKSLISNAEYTMFMFTFSYLWSGLSRIYDNRNSLFLCFGSSVLESPSRLDEEHRLIARYAARLAAEAGNSTVSASPVGSPAGGALQFWTHSNTLGVRVNRCSPDMSKKIYFFRQPVSL